MLTGMYLTTCTADIVNTETGPVSFGLPVEKTHQDNNKWTYTFDEEETLFINCTFNIKDKYSRFTLSLYLQDVTKKTCERIENYNDSITNNFLLTSKNDKEYIICEAKEVLPEDPHGPFITEPAQYEHKVMLRLKRLNSNEFTLPSMETNQGSSHIDKNPFNNDSAFNKDYKHIIWTGISLFTSFTFSLICYYIMRCKCRRKDVVMESLATPNNVINDLSKERTVHPTSVRVENTYAQPTDTKIDDNYADYSEINQSVKYAQPYVEKDINMLYSKIIPKSERNKAKNDTYAEILPKENRDKNKKQKYVNVKDKNNYYNVVNNETYVNSNKSEYAEPSYCELNILD